MFRSKIFIFVRYEERVTEISMENLVEYVYFGQLAREMH